MKRLGHRTAKWLSVNGKIRRYLKGRKLDKKVLAQVAARKEEFEAKQSKLQAKAARNKRDNRRALLFSAGALALALVIQGAISFSNQSATPESSPSASAATSPLVPDVALAESRSWTGTLTINGEQLGVELDGAKAPQSTANFLSLAKSGFYNDLGCHRLTTGGFFVLQCGDPNGDGTGGPGYSWGPIENAPKSDLYPKGTIAMARQGGNAASQGSQFFIVYEDTQIPSDAVGGYSVFGRITTGLEKLAPIVEAGTADGSNDGKPKLEAKLGAIVLN
jgi:peptidyl-prolyl cis-trans isomerase B (cyclophilin B)